MPRVQSTTPKRAPLDAHQSSAWHRVAGIGIGRAEINLIALNCVVDPSRPLRLSLLITGEEDSRSYALPEVLRVTLTPERGAVARSELQREKTLPPQIDQKRARLPRIDYVGEVPANLRGRMRIDAVDMDAPTMVVQLSMLRAAAAAPTTDAAVAAAPADSAVEGEDTPPLLTTPVVRGDDDPNRQDEGRLSFYHPMFYVAGPGTNANAQL